MDQQNALKAVREAILHCFEFGIPKGQVAEVIVSVGTSFQRPLLEALSDDFFKTMDFAKDISKIGSDEVELICSPV